MAGLGWQRRASRGPWALLTAALLYAALGDVVRSEQQIPLSVVKLWASAFGGEIKSIAAKYSGSQLLQKIRFMGKIARLREEKKERQRS
ncbi:hypothetical protein MJT46_015987 [Ovis ammon polii x Ovis aries]|nr:hypothetical protein MJT46_015987 [Ovis ammon polii x Ovis aries]